MPLSLLRSQVSHVTSTPAFCVSYLLSTICSYLHRFFLKAALLSKGWQRHHQGTRRFVCPVPAQVFALIIKNLTASFQECIHCYTTAPKNSLGLLKVLSLQWTKTAIQGQTAFTRVSMLVARTTPALVPAGSKSVSTLGKICAAQVWTV